MSSLHRRMRLDAPNSKRGHAAPSDTCHIIEFIFLMLGTGYMLSYNVLITPIDYYDAVYSDHKSSILFYVVPIHRIFLLLSLLLMCSPCFTYNDKKKNNRISWHFLITLPFFFMFLCLSIYPYLPHYFNQIDESIYFMLLLIICAICGIFGGIVQNAVTEFCNYLPSQYMKASISGQAMAGIIVCIIKICTKLMDETNYALTGKNYFVIGGCMNVLCALLFIGIKNTKLIKYYFDQRKVSNQDYLSRYDSIRFHSKATSELIEQRKMEREFMKHYENENESEQRLRLLSNRSRSEGRQSNVNYRSVFAEIKCLAIATFIVMMTTFLYFPGLETSIKSQYDLFKRNDDWFGILLIFEYNIFDYIGRQFLSKHKWFVNKRNILAIATGRIFVVYPVFFVLYQRYIVSDILLHFINIIGALSNGYLICLMFIFLTDASGKKKGDNSIFNHISATIMTLALNLGILVGSVAAIIIQKFVL